MQLTFLSSLVCLVFNSILEIIVYSMCPRPCIKYSIKSISIWDSDFDICGLFNVTLHKDIVKMIKFGEGTMELHTYILQVWK